MFRIRRSGLLLACAILLGSSPAIQAADYLLGSQSRLAIAAPGTPEGDPDKFDTRQPAIATATGQYRALMVWSADDESRKIHVEEGEDLNVVDNEFEIYGQVMVTNTLETVVSRFRISFMGDDLERDEAARQLYEARNPAVTWNPVAEEFLVVWSADDDTAPMVDDEFEIFGQRVSLGGELLGDRMRISRMGNENASSAAERQRYGADKPAVTVNTVTGEYLVAWQGDHDAAPLVDDELEIFGRVLEADGTPRGEQFRISVAGDDAETDEAARTNFDASEVTVAYNPVSANFVAAWQADDNRFGMVDGEHEIMAQQLDVNGDPVGAMERISAMGPDGDQRFDAASPALSLDTESGTIMVVWHGDDDAAPLVNDENEIHSRLLDATLVPLAGQQRVSRMGAESETDPQVRAAFDATNPAIGWDPVQQQFLVAWRSDDLNNNLVDDEFEMFARFVNLDGSYASGKFRVSKMGPEAETDPEERQKHAANDPALAFDGGAFMLIWNGDHMAPQGADGRFQVWGVRAAYESVELELTRTSITGSPVVPEPVEINFRLSNNGKVTATNVRLRAGVTGDFPFEWSNCKDVNAEGECELGNLEPGKSRKATLTLATDHIELGDNQSTFVIVTGLSDLPVSNASESTFTSFVGVTLNVKGGSGAFGFGLLLLLGVLRWLVPFRHARTP